MNRALKVIYNNRLFSLASQGLSMFPFLQPSDIVYYKKTSFIKITVNDIILTRKNKRLFTHRVIYKHKDYLVTKGDNNLKSDGRIHFNQILGRVYQVKRNGRIFNPESLYLLQSTLYFQEIVRIKKKLEREKIDFVFLKGLPLHLYYEKSHPRRLYLDCDVLVNPKNFAKAEKIMFRSGYTKARSELSSSHKNMKDKEIENAYIKVINGFQVVFDLHIEVVFMMTQLGELNALYPQRLIDQMTNEFLKNKRTVIIQNESFSLLSTNYLLLYLALHFFHHNFRGAFRLQFLDSIMRQVHLRGVLWADISEKILDFKLQNFVYPVFILIKKYYSTPIPASFLSKIKPLHFYTFKPLCSLNVFDDEPRIVAGINRFKNLFFFSPQPLWKKIFVFVNPQVLYSIFWILQKKLFSFFSNRQ